ncbi:MAG: SpoVA/SpoVAEb family sporulation membrane protein [Oscillospiraceae bacterium]|jgi:stage V sporulation protein AE|nr:SpoVA/SpoVAEb family sporulation membrane protein [Oscillospiraceae bacterium]
MELFFALVKAFLVGGAICFLSQLLLDYTKLTMGRILVLLVVLGAALGAVGFYEPFAAWAGAGATVPLTGFGFAMVRGVREAIQKDGWLGILTGAFTAASAGVGAAVLCGLLASFFFKPKER